MRSMLFIAGLLAAPAMAQEPMEPEERAYAFEDVDADGSGDVSLTELRAVDRAVTAEMFAAFDADGSAGLSPDEFESWKALPRDPQG